MLIIIILLLILHIKGIVINKKKLKEENRRPMLDKFNKVIDDIFFEDLNDADTTVVLVDTVGQKIRLGTFIFILFYVGGHVYVMTLF